MTRDDDAFGRSTDGHSLEESNADGYLQVTKCYNLYGNSWITFESEWQSNGGGYGYGTGSISGDGVMFDSESAIHMVSAPLDEYIVWSASEELSG